SIQIINYLNETFQNKLSIALDIFKDRYHKPFLYQLISGQLDVDRMDYLSRDSFFTGVSEGVIGYDRILKMLTVKDGKLMVESKAIYSIEKFLVSRRLMYWQVYLHKTVLSAERMMVNIIKRAKAIKADSPSATLNVFLREEYKKHGMEKFLTEFCNLDDYDFLSAIKEWAQHP